MTLESVQLQLGERFSARIFQSLVQKQNVASEITISKIFAFFLATLVHLVTLSWVGIAGFLIFGIDFNFFALVLGILLLAIVWEIRPRFGKMPENRLERDNFPTLYKLVDEISEDLGAKKVHSIVIEHGYKAFFGQITILRKNVLFLGLPLFAILNGQERVALIAHEIAYGVSNDPMRSFFVRTAVDTLFRLSKLVRPARIFNTETVSGPINNRHASHSTTNDVFGFLTAIGFLPINLFLLLVANIIFYCAYALLALIFRDSQRAKYLADQMASRVSGTEAQLSVLEKTYHSGLVRAAIQNISRADHDKNVFDTIREQMTAMPENEAERLRRINLLEDARVDPAHPPTANRIELIKINANPIPKVTLSVEENQKISAELNTLEGKIQKQLIDEYRASFLSSMK
ncbi:MAG: M48 family metallopeptidase [Chloroflexota bacterium]